MNFLFLYRIKSVLLVTWDVEMLWICFFTDLLLSQSIRLFFLMNSYVYFPWLVALNAFTTYILYLMHKREKTVIYVYKKIYHIEIKKIYIRKSLAPRGSAPRKSRRVDWRAQIKFFSFQFNGTPDQIWYFRLRRWSILIDAADIAKPHVIQLLNEYALRWKLTVTTRRKSNLRWEGDAKEANAYLIIYFASRESFDNITWWIGNIINIKRYSFVNVGITRLVHHKMEYNFGQKSG